MRKTEIEEFARNNPEMIAPTYRQLDTWTRKGLLKVDVKGDHHGQFRDWPNTEVTVAFLVARLVALGFSSDLAFAVARTEPDAAGVRALSLVASGEPLVTVSVGV